LLYISLPQHRRNTISLKSQNSFQNQNKFFEKNKNITISGGASCSGRDMFLYN